MRFMLTFAISLIFDILFGHISEFDNMSYLAKHIILAFFVNFEDLKNHWKIIKFHVTHFF